MDGMKEDMLSENDDHIPSSSVEHNVIPEEDPYDDHLHGEEWDFYLIDLMLSRITTISLLYKYLP